MCGIIGYVSKKREGAAAISELLRGLSTLEYRGYDSAGVAFFDEGGALRSVKASGKLAVLASLLDTRKTQEIDCGIGHTRWATHGEPSDRNAHPHGTEMVQIVHNGIIENYAALKKSEGITPVSDTDTEIAACVIDRLYSEHGHDPIGTLLAADGILSGAYAIGVLFTDRPHELYALRRESPLVVAVAEGANYIASDICACLARTREYYRMENGEVARLTPDGVCFFGAAGEIKEKTLCVSSHSAEAAERGGYPHFMRKEIAEEPSALAKTLSIRIKDGLPCFDTEIPELSRLADARHLYIVACGTAMHAGILARTMLSRLARISASVEIASEFRYCDPVLGKEDAVIFISQSGETADTLAALRLARQRGAYTVSVVNVVGSAIARESDAVLYTYAGPEIAVASTKAYTVQSALLTLLAAAIGRQRKTLTDEGACALCRYLTKDLPDAIEKIIAKEEEIKALAECIKDDQNLFFIGRGIDYAAAMEASLKLKEITYIHSEAYAAGELKHGTISLIEKNSPVIVLANDESLTEKTRSNAQEVLARGARVIAVGTEASALEGVAAHTLPLPPADISVAPIAAATALQLLAYHTACLRGCDVDKPRNLAKSVTVE